MTDALAINLDAPCWLFGGAITRNGYGQVRRKGVTLYAHRYMWTLMRGPIPAGMQIDHLCRVRHCINPQHMEVVTHRENLRRGEGITARLARKTHCPHGHEYTEANTYRPPSTRHRICRECHRTVYKK